MIMLKSLDRENWQQCAMLQVSEDQKDNLPSNLHSIAELQFYPQTKAAVIYNDDVVVGFVTYGIPTGEKVPKIFRLMIDKAYQGSGYGKQAAKQIIKELLTGADEVRVCYNPESDSLRKFYASLGFKERETLPSTLRVNGKMLAVLSKEDIKD